MNFWLRQLRELAVERGRILLVAFGLMWGSLGLTVLLAFGQGLDLAMTTAAESGGVNLLRLSAATTTMPGEGLPAGRWVLMPHSTAAYVHHALPNVRDVSAEYIRGGNTIRHGTHQLNGNVHGVEPAYGHLRHFTPQPGGRFLNQLDEAEHRRVIFLGDTIAGQLFPVGPVIGETVHVRETPFTVIGVMEPRITMNNYSGMDEEKSLIPSTTFRDFYGDRYIDHLIVGLVDPSTASESLVHLRHLIAKRMGVHPDDEAGLPIRNTVEDQAISHGIVNGISIFAGIVGVLGLLVAIIGVANVMFVLVEERRGEIGLLMALGATPRRIALGRLAEGVVVTLLGGAAGVALSALLLWGLDQVPLGPDVRGYLGRPVLNIGLTLGIALLLGVAGCLAGWWPARRAAALDPVEALRDE